MKEHGRQLDAAALRRTVARAKGGDREAFGVLYARFFTPVYRYIFVRVGNPSDADEIAQDVFLKSLAAFVRFEARGDSPLPYFFTIARNLIIDRSRKKRWEPEDPAVLDRERAAGDNPSGDAMRREDAEQLRAAIEILPESEREAVTLRFLSELSYKEIAATTGRSEDAIRQSVSRGLRSLREYFARGPQIDV